MILLPCRPADTLQWDIPPEGDLFFRFDLGLEDSDFPLADEMHFQALAQALAHFTQHVWPTHSQRTRGALLYRGTAELASDIFAYYCQMLAHKLPDELPLWLHFDATSFASPVAAHQALSSTRFEHFQVAVKGLPSYNGLNWEGKRNEAPDALCFPEESFWTDNVMQQLSLWMAGRATPFRVIHERRLTEEWEGVETLHVLPGAVTLQGERKITGFKAAGGEVISLL